MNDEPEGHKLASDIEIPKDLIAVVRRGRKKLAEARAKEARAKERQEAEEKRQREDKQCRIENYVRVFYARVVEAIAAAPVAQYVEWNEPKLRELLARDGLDVRSHDVEIRIPGFQRVVLNVESRGAGMGTPWSVKAIRVHKADVPFKKSEGTEAGGLPEALALAREMWLADNPRPPDAPPAGTRGVAQVGRSEVERPAEPSAVQVG